MGADLSPDGNLMKDFGFLHQNECDTKIVSQTDSDFVATSQIAKGKPGDGRLIFTWDTTKGGLHEPTDK